MRERWSRTKGGPGYSGRTSEREAAVEEREEEEEEKEERRNRRAPRIPESTGENLWSREEWAPLGSRTI